jgi:hypothetical protein
MPSGELVRALDSYFSFSISSRIFCSKLDTALRAIALTEAPG